MMRIHNNTKDMHVWGIEGRGKNFRGSPRDSTHDEIDVQPLTAHNSAAKGPFELRTIAKEAQEHDLSDERGPGTVGGHLNVVMKV